MLYLLGTLIVGVFAGVLSGAFGIGGATITTPLLRDVLKTSGYIALGTPLVVIIPMAFSGAFVYHQKRLIDYRVGLLCAGIGSIAATFTAMSTQYLSGKNLMLITSIYIALVAIKFWQGRSKKVVKRKISGLKILLTGVVAGGISGFLGVGGGIILVPAFTLLLGLPMHKAIGTSLFSMVIYSIPGSMVHYSLGHVDLELTLPLILGSFMGAHAGARIAVKTKDKKLRQFFTAYLFIVAIMMAAFEIFGVVG